MARIRREIWEDEAWRVLSTEAQLVGIVCMVIGATGPCTDARISRKAGIDLGVVRAARDELGASEYAHVLIGSTRRRRMPVTLSGAVFARDGYRCQTCGTSERLTVDHIMPVSKGGSDDLENLQTLCRSCNARKGARIV